MSRMSRRAAAALAALAVGVITFISAGPAVAGPAPDFWVTTNGPTAPTTSASFDVPFTFQGYAGNTCAATPPEFTYTWSLVQNQVPVGSGTGPLTATEADGVFSGTYTQPALGQGGEYSVRIQAAGTCMWGMTVHEYYYFSFPVAPTNNDNTQTQPTQPTNNDNTQTQPTQPTNNDNTQTQPTQPTQPTNNDNTQTQTTQPTQPSEPAAPAPQDLDLALDLAIGSQVSGSQATATAEGLQDGAYFDIVVRSTPQTLATGNVPVGGVVSRSVTLPTLEPGWHSITFTSTWASGGAAVSRIWFQVSATGTLLATSSTAPSLAETGPADSRPMLYLGGFALVAGLALVALRRRREVFGAPFAG